MPLTDVLAVTSEETGCLQLWDEVHSHEYGLHIGEGFLTAFLFQNNSVTSVLEIRDHLQKLLTESRAEFEFTPLPVLQKEFSIPVNQLLVTSVSVLDESATLGDLLPNEQTVFELVHGSEVFLGEELQEFWHRVEKFLRHGASCEELARVTKLPLPQVLVLIYKLRVAGMVAPVRAFHSPAPRRSATRSIRRLDVSQGRPANSLQSVTIQKPERGLLKWLLSKLSPLTNKG